MHILPRPGTASPYAGAKIPLSNHLVYKITNEEQQKRTSGLFRSEVLLAAYQMNKPAIPAESRDTRMPDRSM